MKAVAAVVLTVAVLTALLGTPLPWLAALLTSLLLVALPAGAIGQVSLIDELSPTRRDVYTSTLFALVVIGAVALVIGSQTVGLSAMGLGGIGVSSLVAAVALLGASLALLVIFRVVLHVTGTSEKAFVQGLIPRSGGEKRLFVAVSVAAGAGEEIAYRGFLIPAIDVATGSTWAGVVLSAAAFGALHAYQGPVGMLRSGALGAIFGVVFVSTGDLWGVMIAHAAIDLVAGLVLADWLLAGPRRSLDAVDAVDTHF